MTDNVIPIRDIEKGISVVEIELTAWDIEQALHEYLLQNGQIASDSVISEIDIRTNAYLSDPESFPGLVATIKTPENENAE